MSFHYYTNGKLYRIIPELILLFIYIFYWKAIINTLLDFWNHEDSLKIVKKKIFFNYLNLLRLHIMKITETLILVYLIILMQTSKQSVV